MFQTSIRLVNGHCLRVNLKSPFLQKKEINIMVENRYYIPQKNQLIYCRGQNINTSKHLKLKKNNIIHIIDLRLVINNLKLNIITYNFSKKGLHNHRAYVVQLKSDQIIGHSLKIKKYTRIIESGRILNPIKTFKQQFVQNETTITLIIQKSYFKNKPIQHQKKFFNLKQEQDKNYQNIKTPLIEEKLRFQQILNERIIQYKQQLNQDSQEKLTICEITNYLNFQYDTIIKREDNFYNKKLFEKKQVEKLNQRNCRQKYQIQKQNNFNSFQSIYEKTFNKQQNAANQYQNEKKLPIDFLNNKQNSQIKHLKTEQPNELNNEQNNIKLLLFNKNAINKSDTFESIIGIEKQFQTRDKAIQQLINHDQSENMCQEIYRIIEQKIEQNNQNVNLSNFNNKGMTTESKKQCENKKKPQNKKYQQQWESLEKQIMILQKIKEKEEEKNIESAYQKYNNNEMFNLQKQKQIQSLPFLQNNSSRYIKRKQASQKIILAKKSCLSSIKQISPRSRPASNIFRRDPSIFLSCPFSIDELGKQSLALKDFVLGKSSLLETNLIDPLSRKEPYIDPVKQSFQNILRSSSNKLPSFRWK